MPPCASAAACPHVIQESRDLRALLAHPVLPFVFVGMRSVNAKGVPLCADAFSVSAHSCSATLDQRMSKAMKWNASYNMPVFPIGAVPRRGGVGCDRTNQHAAQNANLALGFTSCGSDRGARLLRPRPILRALQSSREQAERWARRAPQRVLTRFKKAAIYGHFLHIRCCRSSLSVCDQ